MQKNKKQDFIHAKGRRKSSSARIRLYKGKGQNIVNGIAIEEYFPGKVFEILWLQPFTATLTQDKYFVTSVIVGGGKKSQLDAFILGLSKALSLVEKGKFRTVLKKLGLLTRDSRIRERRKIGTGGKARREKQKPKR